MPTESGGRQRTNPIVLLLVTEARLKPNDLTLADTTWHALIGIPRCRNVKHRQWTRLNGTGSLVVGLITRRSRVQIPPPLLQKPQAMPGVFPWDLPCCRLFACVVVRFWSALAQTIRQWNLQAPPGCSTSIRRSPKPQSEVFRLGTRRRRATAGFQTRQRRDSGS